MKLPTYFISHGGGPWPWMPDMRHSMRVLEAALKDMPLESVSATIFHGRPGTPMPPWKAMLSEPEARWIAVRLQQGCI